MTRAASQRPKADLHLHSTCSDGLWPPERVVEKAARCGVKVLALTDHDTFDGIDAARRTASELGVELIPGVEISVEDPAGGERHLLAYGADCGDEALRRALAENIAARNERVGRMLEALAKQGVLLTPEEVLSGAHGSVGRPHVADALVRAGVVRSRQEAFDRWLGDGKPAHVPKGNIGAARAIGLVHDAGGVAVLAHPGRRWAPDVIEALVRAGLDGLEVRHPSHSASQVRALEEMTRRWELLATGGSDCHGDAEGESALRASQVPLQAGERVLDRVAARARGARGGERP